MNRRARRAVARNSIRRSTTIFATTIIPPKLRCGLLLGASGLALAVALGGTREAAAMDECGPAAGTPPSVTCTAAGNPYPNGIWYDVTDLTIVVDKGVIVDTTGTVGELGGIVSGTRFPLAGTSAYGDLVVTVSSGISITTDDTYADGISAGASVGVGDNSATITSQATITTLGDWADGIGAHAYGGDVKVTAGGSITTKGWNSDGIFVSSNITTDHVLVINSSATIDTSGEMASGLRADSEYNVNVDIFIKSSGTITTSGKYAEGIYGSSLHIDSDVTIVNSGAIVTTGDEGHGVRGLAHGPDSAVIISSSGKITTSGESAHGILAAAHGDSSPVTVFSSGKIATSSDEAVGILAGSTGSGSGVTIVSTAGINTIGAGAEGIFGLSGGANSDLMIVSTGGVSTTNVQSGGLRGVTAGANSDIGIVSTAAITTLGHESDGIEAEAFGSGATITIVSTREISTSGDESDGIDASGVGKVTVVSTRAIATKGAESDGIVAESKFGNVAVGASGAISTSGVDAEGIHALAEAGNVLVASTGNITTTGNGSSGAEGIFAKAVAGTVTVNATGSIATAGKISDAVHAEADDAITITAKNASASGLDSDGIEAVNADAGKISIGVTGAVSGGAGAGTGVKVKAVDGVTITIGAGGSIGALSDHALDEGGEDMLVTNKGIITGFVTTDGGNDNIGNAGVWEFRDFADTDGNGVRDAESVAFANFGTGFDIVNNTGTLRLTNVTGAATVSVLGAIVDPFGGDSDVTLDGVEHGQLVNLEQFVNAGTITLQDGVTGDFLAITSAPVHGIAGTSNFTSNGGSLHLDVFLDDGSSGKADMLFLDTATTGTGGATRVFVSNTGGPGALTTGDGIQIIKVDVSSASDAFALGAPVVAGAFQYDLEFQNVAGKDQSWYLRSSPFAGAAAYPSVTSSALTTWRADLAAFQNRLSNLRLNMTAPAVTVPVIAGIAESGSIALDPARFAGGWFSMTESNDSVSQSGIAGFSQETARAEMGFDFALDNLSGNDDWLVIGAFGGQGWSRADFSDADSTADFDVAAMGVYASYFQGPYHVDALVKFDWLDGEYSSDAVSGGGDVQLPVFGVSLNAGYQFDLASSESGGLSLQPLAALDYAHVGGDTFRDDSGAKIELMEMDSLRGRLGARLVQQLLPEEDGTGPVGHLYLQAGVAQEFLGQAEARVTGVTLRQELPETTFDLGAGFDIALPAEGVSFTFDSNADFSGGEDNYGATGGVKFTW